ncbi:hypothetical protein evm_012413 [Chilo suppressalis]|nr:hypothetical protein evm_012413 [Chilo suppressalis]
MIKIIKYGFLPINNDRQRGQNISKGQKLFESGHVFDVTETVGQDQETILTGKIVAQTKISNVYDVKITLDCNRNIKSAICKCKAGLSGQCKHVCALVHYVNSAESADSKTSHAQQWGKPTYRQLLGYDKGVTMAELFPTPPTSIKLNNLMKQQESKDISTATLGKSLAHTPLYKILQLEERHEKEIIAAETLVDLVRITEKTKLNEKIRQLVLEIFTLQGFAIYYYSSELSLPKHLYDFYNDKICCNVDSASNICFETIDQAKSSRWYTERKLRITASNAHKLKGDRFNVNRVINDLLSTKNIETSAIKYGKKMEEVALTEYKNKYFPNCEVLKVGLVVNIHQPWLSCSPDAVAICGNNISDKKLVKIKCPATCTNKPVIERDNLVTNVKYLQFDENGLKLKQNHSIYTQVQMQIYVTGIPVCDLFVYSPKGSVLVYIKRDNMFLSNLVLRLEKFYFTYYLPKLHANLLEENKE